MPSNGHCRKHNDGGWLAFHELNELSARQFPSKLQLARHRSRAARRHSLPDQRQSLYLSSVVLSFSWPRHSILAHGDAVWGGRQPNHLDEAVVSINGKKHFLWRAVDQDGFVLEVLVQSRRDTIANFVGPQ